MHSFPPFIALLEIKTFTADCFTHKTQPTGRSIQTMVTMRMMLVIMMMTMKPGRPLRLIGGRGLGGRDVTPTQGLPNLPMENRNHKTEKIWDAAPCARSELGWMGTDLEHLTMPNISSEGLIIKLWKFWFEKPISESVRFAEDNRSSFLWVHNLQKSIK